MTANGRQLPASFVKFFEEYPYLLWELKEEVDAYGNPLETDFAPYDTVARMEEITARLAEDFGVGGWSPEELQRQTDENRTKPGFISYITDFSKIACFGRSAGGARFCFDFRENTPEPSVIHWDDSGAYWRRVAPNFDTFICLFEQFEEEEEEE